MSGRVKAGKSKNVLDPEEQMRKKFRAKCLFRALGRLVMANTYWLIEAVDHYEGVDDVKRRVQQAVRSKAKKKQLLTITDKALLNKPADERTEHEKKYIYRIIELSENLGWMLIPRLIHAKETFWRTIAYRSVKIPGRRDGLPIDGERFIKPWGDNYVWHVKKKLAALTYFKYYGPGRTIVRQHHEAHAMYFIVTGDMIVSQMVFDELIQQYVSVDVCVIHAGDMFGEVSLLHNIPRTATVTTVGHCELLALMKEDFKNVLQASIQKQWDEVRHAMAKFTYFESLDEVARREGCIVAKMKSYEPNETILGDGVGVPNFVYFILSGRCQMIESIQVVVTSHLGRSFYALYDPYIPKEESEQDFDTKYFGAYKNLQKGSRDSRSTVLEEPIDVEGKHPSSPKVSSILKSTIQPDEARANSLFGTQQNLKRTSFDTSTSQLERPSSAKSEIYLKLSGSTADNARQSVRLSVVPEVLETERPPENLRTYFMQVCQFNPGSSFGFGENMRDRRIVALTPVDCMLLPKIWLLQRNTANIWTRIQHYLEKKIPTKKQLFKEFVLERRWQEFRKQMVDDVVSRSNTVNWTSVHDVPYSIRMEEMLDI